MLFLKKSRGIEPSNIIILYQCLKILENIICNKNYTWKIIKPGIKSLFFQLPFACVVLFSLSIAWSPELRELQISKRQNSANESHDENSRMRQCNNARGKAAIVISLWKLFLTPLVAVMFAKIYKTVELDRFSAGFKAIDTSNPSLLYFAFHIFASFFGYHFGWLACSLCMQKIGYALPLSLATPITLLITNVKVFCETNTVPLPCTTENLANAKTIVAALLLCLAQFMTTTYYLWKSHGLIIASAYDLFWILSYNGMFYW